MKKILPKIPWIVVVAGLIGLLVYGFWPKPIEVDLVEVRQGSLDVTVNDDGETRIREKYIVSAPVAGKILRIQLHAGDRVEQGVTELVRIEPNDPGLLDERTRAEYEARVRTGHAALEQAQSTVLRAREALELADHDYDRAQRLINSNAIARSDFDSIEHRRQIANADVNTALASVKVARFELETAEATLKRFDSNENGSYAEPLRLVSPIDGQVLEVFNEDARVVAPGTPLMKLGDPLDLEIEIDVLSTDAVKMKPGNTVLIEHWGGPQPLEAVIRLIEPSAFLKVSALGVEEKRVNVIADFVDPPVERKTLGDGFRIEARIVIDSTSDDSLNVASGALFRENDKWFVFCVVEAVVRKREVEPGRSNGLETEIKSGLAVGDQVVLHPTDKVRDGVIARINK